MAIKVAAKRGCLKSLQEVYVMQCLGLLDGASPLCIAVNAVYIVKARAHVVMQWAPYGTLFSFLDRETTQIKEADAQVMAWSLLAALDYCHARKVAHRDVKAENALIVHRTPAHAEAAAATGFVFPDGAGPYVAILCDFGEAVETRPARRRRADTLSSTCESVAASSLSSSPSTSAPALGRAASRAPLAPTLLETDSSSNELATFATTSQIEPEISATQSERTEMNDDDQLADLAGSLDYVAPEVLLRAYHPRRADMWSAGVTIFLVFTNQLPFLAATPELTEHRVLHQRESLPRSVLPRLSEDAASLLLNLLRRNPARRLTAAEALCHPWLCADPDRRRSTLGAIPMDLDVPFTIEAGLETDV